MRRAGKKYKDGVQSEAPPFRYIGGEMCVRQKPKFSRDTPGILGPI